MNKTIFDETFKRYLLQPDFINNFVNNEDLQNYFERRLKDNSEIYARAISTKSKSIYESMYDTIEVDFGLFILDKTMSKITEELLIDPEFDEKLKPEYLRLLKKYSKDGELVKKLRETDIFSNIIDRNFI